VQERDRLPETEEERGAGGIRTGPVRGCVGFYWATAIQAYTEDGGGRGLEQDEGEGASTRTAVLLARPMPMGRLVAGPESKCLLFFFSKLFFLIVFKMDFEFI